MSLSLFKKINKHLELIDLERQMKKDYIYIYIAVIYVILLVPHTGRTRTRKKHI